MKHTEHCANCGKPFDWEDYGDYWTGVKDGKAVKCCKRECANDTIRAEIERNKKDLLAQQETVSLFRNPSPLPIGFNGTRLDIERADE